MLDLLLAAPVASAAGMTAAVLLIACPVLTSCNAILLAQLGVDAFFGLHYTFLGVTAAALICSFGAVQAFAVLFAARYPVLNRAGYALIPLIAAAGLWFWSGPVLILLIGAIPVLILLIGAMSSIALARMQEKETDLRLMLLAGTILWTAHDAILGAWIALGADIASCLLGLVMLAALERRTVPGARLVPALTGESRRVAFA